MQNIFGSVIHICYPPVFNDKNVNILSAAHGWDIC